MIRALVVDDEPLARRRLARLLGEIDGIVVAGECASGPEAVEAIGRERPDLVLLDVQMPEMSGLEVVERVGAADMPPVVFVTAHDEHALAAFRVHAVDYLLKPVHPERFAEAMTRVRERILGREATHATARLERLLRELADRVPAEFDVGATSHLERLQIEERGRRRIVRIADVERFEASGNYVEVRTISGHTHLLRVTLATLDGSLDPARFLRVHRSRIVNLDRVVGARPAGSGDLDLELAGGAVVRLSRSYREEFDRRMGPVG